MVLSGLGLIGLGAAALLRSLDAAQVLAQSSARDAARSTARLLRRELSDVETLVELGARRFRAVGGELEVAAAWQPLTPLDDPGRGAVDVSLRALATPAVTEEERERLVEHARSAGADAACWLWSWLGWQAWRADDADRAKACLEALLERVPSVVEPGRAARPRTALQSGLLLAAALGCDDDRIRAELVPWVATAPADEVGRTVARLRERGAPALADALEARAAEVERERRVLRAVDAVLAQLVGRGGDGGDRLLGVDGAVVTWSVTRAGDDEVIVGAWLAEPVTALQRATVAGRLDLPIGLRMVADERGVPAELAAEPAVADAVYLVPDPLGTAPGTAGAWGLGLVLLACGGLFGWSLFTARRALRGEADALRSRAEFLQSVTHELKTPLASIRLLAERLHEGRVRREEKRHEHHALLAGEAARLTVLIENVLDLGRMERRERGYDRRPQEIDDVVREACRLFAPVAQAAGMELREGYGAEGVVGRIDRSALVQALVNVMENARKYAAAGGVVEVTTAITVGDRYALRVRDRGPGVAEGERERIFERFVRGSAQRDGSVSGVGLGLHLARRIAEAHDGTLHCEAPGDGTGAVFEFRLAVDERERHQEEGA